MRTKTILFKCIYWKSSFFLVSDLMRIACYLQLNFHLNLFKLKCAFTTCVNCTLQFATVFSFDNRTSWLIARKHMFRILNLNIYFFICFSEKYPSQQVSQPVSYRLYGLAKPQCLLHLYAFESKKLKLNCGMIVDCIFVYVCECYWHFKKTETIWTVMIIINTCIYVFKSNISF